MATATIENTLDNLAATGREEYIALVFGAVENPAEPLDPNSVREILTLAGKTPADLKADCDRVGARKNAAENLTKAADAQREAISLRGELRHYEQEHGRVCQLAEQQVAAAWKPIDETKAKMARLTELENRLRADAGNLLFRTSDPGIGRRTAALTSQIAEQQGIINAKQGLVKNIPTAQARLDKRAPELDRMERMVKGTAEPAQQTRDKLAELQRKAADDKAEIAHGESAKQTIAAAKARIAELEKEMAAAEAERMDWRSVDLFSPKAAQ